MIRKIQGQLKRWVEGLNDIGRSCRIDPTARVKGCTLSGEIVVGEGCRLFKSTLLGQVTLGRHTSIWGPNVNIFARRNRIVIGSFCSVARNVSIQEYEHKTDRLSTYFISQNILDGKLEEDIVSKGDVRIGNDVWIGDGAKILTGVTIGDGAVVGAQALINRDVPPYAIVGGIPAKVLGYRFPDPVIERLLALRWWEWPLERIRSQSDLFLGRIEANRLDTVKGNEEIPPCA